jgi:hypothetical protein
METAGENVWLTGMLAQGFLAVVFGLRWRVYPADLVTAEGVQFVQRLEFSFWQAELCVEDFEQEGHDGVALLHVPCEQITCCLLLQEFWRWQWR